jgi:hypothetical protein
MYHHIDLKVQFMTAIAILIASQQVETFLRFTLLLLSIVYTIYRLIDRFDEKKKEKFKQDAEKQQKTDEDERS